MKNSLKYLFLILIAFFSLGNANILSADENIAISGLDQSKVVETIIPEPVIEEKTVVPETQTVQTQKTVVAPKLTNYISISGRTLEIRTVSDTSVDAGDHVNKYGDKFLYGHNSSQVFGILANLPVGTTFSVTTNGLTKTYQIAQKVTFEKDRSTGLLQLDGDGNFMYAVSLARFQGKAYDLSIMTCAGVSYGNGDASHRLVIFANEM